MASTIEIFCCYARRDKLLLDELKTHLEPLQRQGFIGIWNDTDISPGSNWEEEIHKHLDTAHIILLFVSPDFIKSNYCYSIEMKQAVERHERKEAVVIPVILRYVQWQITILGKLQALPTGARPVKSWQDQDEAFYNIAEGIRKVVEEISKPPLSRKAEPVKEIPSDQSSEPDVNGQGLLSDLEALKKKFNEEMWRIYYEAQAIGPDFDSEGYYRLLKRYKGSEVKLAHDLLKSNKPTYKYAIRKLRRMNHLNLTVEALVLKPEYASLFTENEREEARRRLEEID